MNDTTCYLILLELKLKKMNPTAMLRSYFSVCWSVLLDFPFWNGYFITFITTWYEIIIFYKIIICIP